MPIPTDPALFEAVIDLDLHRRLFADFERKLYEAHTKFESVCEEQGIPLEARAHLFDWLRRENAE